MRLTIPSRRRLGALIGVALTTLQERARERMSLVHRSAAPLQPARSAPDPLEQGGGEALAEIHLRDALGALKRDHMTDAQAFGRMRLLLNRLEAGWSRAMN